jgi:hypothetical protein
VDKKQTCLPIWATYLGGMPPYPFSFRDSSPEVIEGESQVVLNTLKEHDFKDAYKEWQKRW